MCRLEKVVEFHALPREGEWVKLSNRELGDYFPIRVGEVTHREGSYPEIMLDRLGKDGRPAFDETELDEYVAAYQAEGWALKSTVPNTSGSGPA